jgi:FkbM family methyltransferase
MNYTLVKGLCGRTHHFQNDCEEGDRGVLLRPKFHFNGGWDEMARECANLCLACARCNVISFSLAERECDWFHDCDLGVLETVDKPWKTMMVNQLEPPPERIASGLVPLRSHTFVRWNGTTVRLYIVDDWAAEWILQESHSEAMVTRVFRRFASDCVDDPDILILDVGANSGYYSFISAALGCSVVAFEPQPGCLRRIVPAIEFNRFHEAIRIVQHPVGFPQRAPVAVSPNGCRGDLQLPPGTETRNTLPSDAHMVRFTTVQNALQNSERSKRIALIKIDTEGAEGMVLSSLMPYMDRIDNLVVETTPWRWPLVSNMTRVAVADVYASLLDQGRFAMAYIHSPIAPARWIKTPKQMHRYIGTTMSLDFWGMVDIWFGRDALLMKDVYPFRSA